MRPYLPGMRFGLLTIVEHVPRPEGRRTGGRWYRCRCDCGNMTTKSQGAIRNGSTKSCGCLRRKRAAELSVVTAKAKGAFYPSAVMDLYRRYKKSARKMRRVFKLTVEQCAKLFESPCVYCGQTPSMEVKAPAKYSMRPVFYASGLDRFNNKVGYTPTNTVSCCSACNHMKSDRRFEDWLAHMARVLRHQRRVL